MSWTLRFGFQGLRALQLVVLREAVAACWCTGRTEVRQVGQLVGTLGAARTQAKQGRQAGFQNPSTTGWSGLGLGFKEEEDGQNKLTRLAYWKDARLRLGIQGAWVSTGIRAASRGNRFLRLLRCQEQGC